MVVIVDYGLGNLQSIAYKLDKIKISNRISSSLEVISDASKLILPGVGHFSAGMRNITDSGLDRILERKVLIEHTPILGICLGLQLFTQSSEEGNSKGLGWIKGCTRRFSFEPENIKLRIPHVGWNTIEFNKDCLLFEGIAQKARFYFTHSFHLCKISPKEACAFTEYGYQFVSAVAAGNIYGTQFHPEKSHKTGIMIIQNFIKNT